MNSLFALGGPVMYALLACSVVSLAVVLERAVFWLGVRWRRDRRAVELLISLAAGGRLNAAARAAEKSKDYYAGVVGRALALARSSGPVSPDRLAEAALAAELPGLRRYLPVLDTVITAAPLLGILGTVAGIITAFGFLSPAGGDPRAVTGGIATALLTTAAGLVVALMSLVPYNYFLTRAEDAAAEIEKTVLRLRFPAGEEVEE